MCGELPLYSKGERNVALLLYNILTFLIVILKIELHLIGRYILSRASEAGSPGSD